MLLSAENLSKYRQQLFGIGAIGILLVHSTYQVKYPICGLEKICGCGGIGVYIFAFLSGIGLYFSLRTANSGDSKRRFWKKRLQRVLVPYLMIAGFWYGIKYFILRFSLFGFFYELSTLSFWLEHRGAWYVAMLVPLYAIYPFYYEWVERSNRKRRAFLSIGVGLVVVFAVAYILPSLYKHLSQVLSGIIIFMLGHYIGKYVYDKEQLPWGLGLFCILIIYIKAFTPFCKEIAVAINISYALFGIILSVICSWILNLIRCKHIMNILSFFGGMSLELYLTNVFLIQVANEFQFSYTFGNHNLNPYGLIDYSVTVLSGIGLSIVAKKLEEKMLRSG